jgi:hypothetical protein
MTERFDPRAVSDDPHDPHATWRYYVTTPAGKWLGTVFLDDRGTLAVHSVFGPASYDWPDASIDPRITFAQTDEDDDAAIAAAFSAWRPASSLTVKQIVRALFPRFRVLVRRELEREYGVASYRDLDPDTAHPFPSPLSPPPGAP